jgi:hypothetical protein
MAQRAADTALGRRSARATQRAGDAARCRYSARATRRSGSKVLAFPSQEVAAAMARTRTLGKATIQ